MQLLATLQPLARALMHLVSTRVAEGHTCMHEGAHPMSEFMPSGSISVNLARGGKPDVEV
jgi:hypothetical protein